jgi:hypothetical protein
MTPRRVLALIFLCVAAFAQDFRATLTGTVTDPSGAAVPGANVKATNTGTNAVKEVKATSDGVYTIPYLDPGVYDIEVTASGFQGLKRTAITLQVAQKMNLPVQLTVGQMTQEVTVVGQQEVIDTADASRGLVFDPIKTQEYPLNGRQSYMLMSLTPGVIFGQEVFGATGFSGTRGWDVNNSYKINGARQGSNLFLLNGAPISDFNGQWEIAPNVEGIQEFKVMTNTYDAGYGRFQGGVVNTTMKSGTNTLHGDVFDYWRNSIMDANFFQSNYAGLKKGFHNQHQFGGVVTGPIRKDKDFLMFSFEGWQEVVPFAVNNTTPNMLLRDGQHFTQFGLNIYDPLTTHPCTAGSGAASTEPCSGSFGSSYWRNPFPGNVIPQNRISPVGQKILSYYPAENAPGLNNNFVAGGNLGRYWYNQPLVRWDHTFGANDKFYAMYTWQHGYEYRSSSGYPKPAAQGNSDNERTFNNIIADWTHILTSTTVLDVRASYMRFTQLTPGYNNQAMQITSKDLGMTQMIHSPTSSANTTPGFRVSSYDYILGNGSLLGTWQPNNQWNFAPSVTMTRGKHTIKAGFELNYYARGDGGTSNSQGFFTFDSTWTRAASGRSLPGTNDQFNSIASTLLGFPASGAITVGATFYRSRPYYAGFVQDDWKVTPKLTLNIGIRYDVQIPWLERYDRSNRGFDFNNKSPVSDQVIAQWNTFKAQYDATNPKYPYPNAPSVIVGQWLFPGNNGQPRRLYNTDWTNLGPRFGFAYRIKENTVLRGGVGVFYKSPTQTNTTTGLSQTTNYTNSLDSITPSACSANCLTGPYSLVNPFPNGLSLPLGAAGGPLTSIGNSVGFDPAGYKIPRTYQYSLGFQQQLFKKIVAEVSYSGNMQVFDVYGLDMNWPAGQAGLDLQNAAINDPTFFSQTLNNPFYGFLPTTSSRGGSPTLSRSALLGMYPLWNSSMTNNLISKDFYRSDELQTKIEQRALSSESAGVLTWVFSWTFGKEYEKNHRLTASWDTTQDLYYEVSNQDKTHNLSFSGVYDLPVGKNKKFLNHGGVANKVFGDWRVTPILVYVSGNPTSWPNAINYCGKWTVDNPDQYHWFNNNASCYAAYPSNTLRSLPDRFPGNIRDPQKPQVNVAVEKNLALTERYKLQFRADMFNVMNTAIRGTAGTTFTDPTTFGILPPNQKNFPRLVQLAGKFFF